VLKYNEKSPTYFFLHLFYKAKNEKLKSPTYFLLHNDLTSVQLCFEAKNKNNWFTLMTNITLTHNGSQVVQIHKLQNAFFFQKVAKYIIIGKEIYISLEEIEACNLSTQLT